MVPAKGVERWLTQRLSHRLGTSARAAVTGSAPGVRFLNPRSLVSMLLDRERDDPWDPDRLVWPLLATIDASLDEPWCATLAAHLGHGLEGDDGELRRNRRYSVARRLAGLFASYAVQRPTLVTDWREGRDTDGAGGALDDDLLWQAELWRRLLGRVDEPPPDVRHADTLARLRAGGEGLDLPSRLSLFGHTRLPVTEVELLAGARREPRRAPLAAPALAARCGTTWPASADRSPRDRRHVRRAGRPPAARLARPRHPRAAARCSRRRSPTGDRDVGRSLIDEPDTLLGWLQHDLRANHAPTVAERADAPPRRRRPQPPGARLPRCRPARSTCCARCWSGCSRTTPPSSRATSS